MPFTKKQHHMFAAIAHGWKPPASSGIHISREDAARMAAEGIKGEGKGGSTHSGSKEGTDNRGYNSDRYRRKAQQHALREMK